MNRIFLWLTLPFIFSGYPRGSATLDPACEKYAPQEYMDANFILVPHLQFSDCYLDWVDHQRN
jgi:hypothetical protein